MPDGETPQVNDDVTEMTAVLLCMNVDGPVNPLWFLSGSTGRLKSTRLISTTETSDLLRTDHGATRVCRSPEGPEFLSNKSSSWSQVTKPSAGSVLSRGRTGPSLPLKAESHFYTTQSCDVTHSLCCRPRQRFCSPSPSHIHL